jgi:hypothetical protein
MLENSVSFFKLQKIFHIILGGLFGLSAAFSLWVFATYMMGSDSLPPFSYLSLMEKRLQQRKEKDPINVASLFSSREEASSTLRRIDQEIRLYSVEERPDIDLKDRPIAIVINRLKSPFFVTTGSPIYIDYDAKNCVLTLTEQQTPFSITFENESGGAILARSRVKSASLSREREFLLEVLNEKMSPCLKEDFKKILSPLQKAKCYPPDAIFRIYGGEQYSHFQNLYRLEIPCEGGSAISFVAPNDILIWDEKFWRKPNEGEQTRFYPVVHIAKVLDQKIEIVAFNLDGEQFLRIPLLISRPKGKVPNCSEIFATPKVRSPHSISCRLGEKNMILREGDWLIRASKGWRLLKTAEEFEAVLDYRISGDLLILDKIEKEAEGFLLRGHYFDSKRSFAEKITLPIVERKKSIDSRKKKNMKSATMESYELNL